MVVMGAGTSHRWFLGSAGSYWLHSRAHKGYRIDCRPSNQQESFHLLIFQGVVAPEILLLVNKTMFLVSTHMVCSSSGS